jgi:hypothetical protein
LDAITSSGSYLGTDRIGRPLTDAESKQLAQLLRKHGFKGANIVALRFAYKLARSKAGAEDLRGRTWLRFIRWGWDPNKVTLVRGLCRLVWSEHTHQVKETEKARTAEEAFIAEQLAAGELVLPAAPQAGDPLRQKQELVAPSYEQKIERLDAERDDDERRQKKLAQMRTALGMLRERLDEQGDEVNADWLKLRLEGIESPKDMAKETRRRPEDFYAAQKRRGRVVRSVLAEVTGERQLDDDEEKS